MFVCAVCCVLCCVVCVVVVFCRGANVVFVFVLFFVLHRLRLVCCGLFVMCVCCVLCVLVSVVFVVLWC